LRCGISAECMLVNGKPQCACQQGYHGLPEQETAGCLDIDECSISTPCGKDALCRNSPGGFLCECPAGYQGNPLQGCIPSIPAVKQDCRNIRCGQHEECVPVDSNFVCVCR